MAVNLKTFITTGAFLGVFILPIQSNSVIRAATPTAADPCGARLPLWDGASGLQFSTLRAGQYTLTLGQYGRDGTRQILRGLHGTQAPGDTVEQFEFTLPGKTHYYSGLVHAFTHGPTQHVCAQQPLYVDHGNSAYDIAHPRAVMMRVDGIVAGTIPNATGIMTMGAARFTIQVGRAHYSVFGFMKSL